MTGDLYSLTVLLNLLKRREGTVVTYITIAIKRETLVRLSWKYKAIGRMRQMLIALAAIDFSAIKI